MSESSGAPSTSSGFGRLLVAVYAVFALAATARSAVQISTRFHEAPVAYLLSSFSAVVYIVATVALAKGSAMSHRVAVVAISTELAGVLAIGALSVFDQSLFPDATVWSDFGRGYVFIPLVLPFVGLWWLRRTRQA